MTTKQLYAIIIQTPTPVENIVYVWADSDGVARRKVCRHHPNAVIVGIDVLVEAQRLAPGVRVGYSLLPLDVGFDLRATRSPVQVPADVETRGLSCLLYGKPYVLYGAPHAIAIGLRLAGYNVADAEPANSAKQ